MSDKSQVPNPKSQVPNPKIYILWSLVIIWNLVLGAGNFSYLFAADQNIKEPVTVNGDTVEYSTDNKEVTAVGNVSITYKDTKLTCEKIKINTETKDAQASGNVRLEDKKGVIEGEKIEYNFQNKTGVIIDSKFRSNPFFGRGEKLDKVSDAEFIAYRAYVSTCSYDRPHYRMKTKKLDFFPGDKVQIRGVTVTGGQQKQIPLFYIPQYNHSFKDPFMHVQLMPGKSKNWGQYMLSAWRYELTDSIKGRIYLDYRSKLGIAEGFIANYTSKLIGKGDFKYYYTQERDKSGRLGRDVNVPKVFQRYFVRWRHKWDIDEQTNFISQYFKIIDSRRALFGSENNFLKDYFPREFDKDTQPPSYAQLHRSFKYSGIDFVFQKRINRWYPTYLEKLPYIQYSLPSVQLGETPFFFENNSTFARFIIKQAVPSPSSNDIESTRTDTYNKFSLPAKVAFINFTPFVASRQTYYDKDIYGSSIPPRTIFYTGADLSTKFYRIFNVKSNFLGLDINGLRHIITPTINYSYNHQPTILSTKLKQISESGIDSIGYNNSVSMGLQNKLQTKRKNQTIDLLDFRIDSGYTVYSVDTSSNIKKHGRLSDFTLNLDFLPYAWMRLRSDATYSTKQKYFTGANADLNFNFANERSIGLGQRYQRKGGKELTFSSDWRLSPKWKIGIYERIQFAKTLTLKGGLREQRYTLSRDLHCWTMEISFDEERGKGATLWLILRLKAFPELEFNLNKAYNAPKPGSQAVQQ